MIKHFRFTLELKANIHDKPKGPGTREEFDSIQRLAQRIAARDETLIEVYKITFLDLLLGDYYTEEINQKVKTKPEKELILPAANKMAPRDLEFFTQLFPESAQEALRLDKDDVLNLFYSQFGKPKIVEVRFECQDSCKGKQESSL